MLHIDKALLRNTLFPKTNYTSMKESTFQHSQKYNLLNSVEYAESSVVSKIINKSEGGNVTLFSFDEGENLSEHTAPFDAIVYVLDGSANVKINQKEHHLQKGDFIIMPANIPHALSAPEKFKMLLIMVK